MKHVNCVYCLSAGRDIAGRNIHGSSPRFDETMKEITRPTDGVKNNANPMTDPWLVY